jgi:hypothetical protein
MIFLKRPLKQLAGMIQPSSEFRVELWSRLSVIHDGLYPIGRSGAHRFRFGAVALASLVLLFGLGTGVYAYESPEVVSGHPLFFLKESVETVEGSLARSPEARIAFHARMMARRLDEGERLLLKNPQQLDQTLEAAATHMELTVTEIGASVEDEQLRERMIELLSIHHARLAELSARRNNNTEQTVLTKLQSRIKDRGLSEDEQARLFEIRARSQERREIR